MNRQDIKINGADFVRAQLDLDEIMNDQLLNQTRTAVQEMMSDYKRNTPKKSEKESFIRNTFADALSEKHIKDEIKEAKSESSKNDLDEITAEWVKEWHREKQSLGKKSKEEEERKDFICCALENKTDEELQTVASEENKNKSKVRSLYIRYISLSAAAILGAFILIRTLAPVNPEKLYESYYTPYKALSPVSRGENGAASMLYSSGIKLYNAGDYAGAASSFAEASVKDPSYGSPMFFLGLTDLALGNFDGAIENLDMSVIKGDEYQKEALWYMGLAYLKKGEKAQASECFEKLSEKNGYYSERSEELLRRLK
jgi:tetratricopeptide (TPR) repeat protein